MYYSTVSTKHTEHYSEPVKSSPHSQNPFTFLYLLFNNNSSRSDYVASNSGIISEGRIVKCKRCGSKWSWHNLNYYPRLHLEVL